MKALWIAAALAAVGTPATADPAIDALGAALATHSDADVAALRAQLPGDASVRCTLGAVYAKRGDLSRAALYLTDCYGATLPDAIGVEIRKAVREIKKPMREQLSELAITSNPLGMTIEVDALPGELLVAPVTVWLKPGAHKVIARGEHGAAVSNTATTEPYSRSTMVLVAGAPSQTPTRNGVANFEDESVLEKHDGGPSDIKHPSMMTKKQLGQLEPLSGPQLADPLATAAAPTPVALWLGLRIGGGMFDDGAATARLRPSIAAAARLPLRGPLFLAARLDWSRRGGTSDSSIDTLGVSAGVGYPLVGSLAAIGQLRGDLRFADTRNMMAVRRAGASVAIGLELAIPSTPLTAGLRFEQGLTELVAGARDRAALVELGVDLR